MACHATGAVSALHFAGMWGNAFLTNSFTDDEQMNVAIISEETTTRQEAIGSALWWIKPADCNFYSGCGGEIICHTNAARYTCAWPQMIPWFLAIEDITPSNKVKRKNVPSFLLSRSLRMGVCLISSSLLEFCSLILTRTMCCFCHYW